MFPVICVLYFVIGSGELFLAWKGGYVELAGVRFVTADMCVRRCNGDGIVCDRHSAER